MSYGESSDEEWAIFNKNCSDIHATHTKHPETFVKTELDDLGAVQGILSKVDPVKHREIAKRLSPAFSTRNSTAKEATLQKYVDFSSTQWGISEEEKMVLKCGNGKIG